jgi:hypothetical protein
MGIIGIISLFDQAKLFSDGNATWQNCQAREEETMDVITLRLPRGLTGLDTGKNGADERSVQGWM